MEKAVTMRLSSGGSSVDWAAEAEAWTRGEERRHRRRCRPRGKPDGDDDNDTSAARSLCRRWCCCCCGTARADDALGTRGAALQRAAAEKERVLSIVEREE